MRRGDIWTVSGGKDYAGKPRPVVIVQDDSFDATDSITICALTTDPTEAPLFRLPVEPNERNGLRSPSRLMVDKITTAPKSKVGQRIGRLDDEDVVRLNQAVMVFLGLAVSPRTGRKAEGWETPRPR
jgi:mRNA interferase MazF